MPVYLGEARHLLISCAAVSTHEGQPLWPAPTEDSPCRLQPPGHNRAKSNESWRWCRIDSRRAEEPGKAQSRVGRDGAPVLDDRGNAGLRDVDGLGQAVLGDAERFQKLWWPGSHQG